MGCCNALEDGLEVAATGTEGSGLILKTYTNRWCASEPNSSYLCCCRKH